MPVANRLCLTITPHPDLPDSDPVTCIVAIGPASGDYRIGRNSYHRLPLRLLIAMAVLVALAPILRGTEIVSQPIVSSPDLAQTENQLGGNDELWLVSTRHLGAPQIGQSIGKQLRVYHWCDGRFQTSSMNEFNAGDRPDRLTTVYLPGNRSTTSTAIQRGWKVYDSLRCKRAENTPLRMVIWDWPSDRIFGMMRDVRAKAARTDIDAFYFAAFLRRMKTEQPVSLVAFSYGSRIAMGGIHLHQGGQLAGRELSSPTAAGYSPDECVGVQCRLILLAAAIDSNGIDQTGRYSHAPQGLSDLLLLVNHRDPVLSKYPFLAGVPAAGFQGLNTRGFPGARVIVHDVTSLIRRSHSEDRYYSSGTVMNDLCHFVWGSP